MIFEQNPDDPNCWTDSDCLFGDCNSVELIVETNGSAPDEATVSKLSGIANNLADYTQAAAALILENYSYEHFADLGVDPTLLVDETVADVANAATLVSVFVSNADEETFDMSFTVPWDSHHSFDVEFENGVAETCSVNG